MFCRQLGGKERHHPNLTDVAHLLLRNPQIFGPADVGCGGKGRKAKSNNEFSRVDVSMCLVCAVWAETRGGTKPQAVRPAPAVDLHSGLIQAPAPPSPEVEKQQVETPRSFEVSTFADARFFLVFGDLMRSRGFHLA